MNYIAKILMNSSYGRFGMDDNFDDLRIMTNKEYTNFENKYMNIIKSFISLDNNILVKFENQDKINNLLDNGSITHSTNIAIAAAITAYARIEMSQFKNNPLFNLYYSDTDSIYIDSKLPDDLVSNTILGKMKLESVITKAIFICPKVYAYLTEDNKEIIKIKGLTKEAIKDNNISLSDLENLLIKDSKIEANQNKWFKYLNQGTISIKEQIYSLKVTGNNRGDNLFIYIYWPYFRVRVSIIFPKLVWRSELI
jgi:hypothetical protein